MRQNYLLSVALLLCSLMSCRKDDPAPVVSGGLGGNWSGDYQTQQAGECSWGSPPVTAKATFLVVSNTVTATITQTVGPNSIAQELTGILNGNTVSLTKINNSICNGTPGTYISHFGGTINGDELTLVSRDTVCPAQGCIFLKTMKLTRQ